MAPNKTEKMQRDRWQKGESDQQLPCAGVAPGTRQLWRPAGNLASPDHRHLKSSSPQMLGQYKEIIYSTRLLFGPLLIEVARYHLNGQSYLPRGSKAPKVVPPDRRLKHG